MKETKQHIPDDRRSHSRREKRKVTVETHSLENRFSTTDLHSREERNGMSHFRQ